MASHVRPGTAPASAPILIPVDLFRELDSCLISLLKDFSLDDWHKPTVCREWCVKDIASHLLGENFHRLSLQRDGYRAPADTPGGQDDRPLAAILYESNQAWTRATSGLSPALLISLLEATNAEFQTLLDGLEPFQPALHPVSWAGESKSENWMDIARIYTEKWHHQRQIADAVSRDSGIDARHLYHPVLDTFMRALPYTFRDMQAAEGDCLKVVILGEAGGEWFLVKTPQQWALACPVATVPKATATIPQDAAWRIFTKRWDREKKMKLFPSIKLEGDFRLSSKVLDMVSIIA